MNTKSHGNNQKMDDGKDDAMTVWHEMEVTRLIESPRMAKIMNEVIQEFHRLHASSSEKQQRDKSDLSKVAREWVSGALRSLTARPVTAYARSMPTSPAEENRRLVFDEISLPDGSKARVFWNKENSWYEIEFDRGSATAIRIGDQEFPLIAIGDGLIHRIEAPCMIVARALRGAQVIAFDYKSSLP